MGYTTDFSGEFALDRPLAPEHRAYLQAFSDTRRIRRHSYLTAQLSDPVREAIGLIVGPEGAYYVGGEHEYAHGNAAVIDCNSPPPGQPGLWCKWEPNEDGTTIRWSGAEKFYDYVEWLNYLIGMFLVPWGYRISGSVKFQGEDAEDFGKIVIRDGRAETVVGSRSYGSKADLRSRLDDYLDRLNELEGPTISLGEVTDEIQTILFETAG